MEALREIVFIRATDKKNAMRLKLGHKLVIVKNEIVTLKTRLVFVSKLSYRQ